MDASATGVEGLFAGDLNSCKIREGRDSLRGADRVKNGGEKRPEGAKSDSTRGLAEAGPVERGGSPAVS